MIITVSCGYAPALGNGPLGKVAWTEILTEDGSTINGAPDAGRFGRPFFDIAIGKAGFLTIGSKSAVYYPAGQRLVLPANPGDRVYWQDRMRGSVVILNRATGLVRRDGGDETFAVRERAAPFRPGDAVTFNTTRDVDRQEWAIDLQPA